MTNTILQQNGAPGAATAVAKLTVAAVARSAALAMLVLLGTGLAPGSGAVYAQQAEPVPIDQPVNINRADAATLAASLNGVGPSRAEEIVRYREAYGPFRSVEELTEVKGIGPSTLERNRALITLE